MKKKERINHILQRNSKKITKMNRLLKGVDEKDLVQFLIMTLINNRISQKKIILLMQ